MPRLRRSVSPTVAAALLCLASACHADEAPAANTSELPVLGVMGTIPIYWGESGDFGEVLSGGGTAHWARAQLEADYQLEPLDALTAETLEGLDFVLLAQPRALGPAENVALDEWVRSGGHLLLFADPMLTGDSRFPIGDRRRPQDVILLSPILDHWGLTLAFDDERQPGYALVSDAGTPIPVNLPGALAVHGGEGTCRLAATEVLASCTIGKGSVVVLADAALLDLHSPHPAAAAALDRLLKDTFVKNGDGAGRSGP
jgi:hypothetical protein